MDHSRGLAFDLNNDTSPRTLASGGLVQHDFWQLARLADSGAVTNFPMEVSDIEDLAQRFRAGAVTREEWTHDAHLVVAAWHVANFGVSGALAALRAGIRRLNEHHGTPNSETRGYHETVTRAYVSLIAKFLESCASDATLEARVTRLLAAPLAQRNALEAFWSPEVLWSGRARLGWVEPDRAPLDC